jgi:hypothetical protein
MMVIPPSSSGVGSSILYESEEKNEEIGFEVSPEKYVR